MVNFLRKIRAFKLSPQGGGGEGGHYLLSLNMGPVISLLANRKFNNLLKVPIQTNTQTPGLARYY